MTLSIVFLFIMMLGIGNFIWGPVINTEDVKAEIKSEFIEEKTDSSTLYEGINKVTKHLNENKQQRINNIKKTLRELLKLNTDDKQLDIAVNVLTSCNKIEKFSNAEIGELFGEILKACDCNKTNVDNCENIAIKLLNQFNSNSKNTVADLKQQIVALAKVYYNDDAQLSDVHKFMTSIVEGVQEHCGKISISDVLSAYCVTNFQSDKIEELTESLKPFLSQIVDSDNFEQKLEILTNFFDSQNKDLQNKKNISIVANMRANQLWQLAQEFGKVSLAKDAQKDVNNFNNDFNEVLNSKNLWVDDINQFDPIAKKSYKTLVENISEFITKHGDICKVAGEFSAECNNLNMLKLWLSTTDGDIDK